MAHVVYRRKGKVYLYYYDTLAAKLVQVPRSVTKSWDGLPPEEVEVLKRRWEEDHGKARDRIARVTLTGKLASLWESYQTHRKRFKKRSARTTVNETAAFETYICGFFLIQHQKKDPTHWHPLVPEFHNWLFEQPLKDATRRKILWTLERFGKYLVFIRVMSSPFVIQTPTRDNLKETPLKVKLTPEQVLSICRSHSFRRPPKKHASVTRIHNINFRLAALVGYFCSLRPEELWALNREDFATGDLAVERAKTRVGLTEAGLGSRLSVAINKTLTASEVLPMVKTHYSFGWVNVWHPEAAKAIAALLKDMPPGRLFPFTRGYLDKAWKEIAKPIIGTTVHDLRRASGLYLGRTVRIPPTLLQEHMRHSEIETTMLYTRAPREEEARKEVVDQDFDDVV